MDFRGGRRSTTHQVVVAMASACLPRAPSPTGGGGGRAGDDVTGVVAGRDGVGVARLARRPCIRDGRGAAVVVRGRVVCHAEEAWMVPNTKWPVSAARIAASNVS